MEILLAISIPFALELISMKAVSPLLLTVLFKFYLQYADTQTHRLRQWSSNDFDCLNFLKICTISICKFYTQ